MKLTLCITAQLGSRFATGVVLAMDCLCVFSSFKTSVWASSSILFLSSEVYVLDSGPWNGPQLLAKKINQLLQVAGNREYHSLKLWLLICSIAWSCTIDLNWPYKFRIFFYLRGFSLILGMLYILSHFISHSVPKYRYMSSSRTWFNRDGYVLIYFHG